MTHLTRFSEAIDSARKLEADRFIRRHWDLVDPAYAEQENEKFGKAAKDAAGAPSQPSFNVGRGVVRSSKITAEIGDTALPLSSFEMQGGEYRGATVVACAWLVLYVLAFSGLEFKQAAALLASLY